jgi:hypothetical protein
MKVKNIVSRLLREEYENKSVLLEYSDKFINNLVPKYVEQGAQEDDAREHIELFSRYSPGLPVDQRDIVKYSWSDLQNLIYDKVTKKRKIKAGKIGDKNVDKDDIVYNNDGVRIYRGDSEEKCVRYGNGYNFCISSRGDDNYYRRYKHMYGYRKYYFIFNDNLPPENQNHILVLTKSGNHYSIWDALNRLKQKHFFTDFDEVVGEYPWLNGLYDILV